MSKAKTVKQPVIPPMNDEGHVWIPFNRDIVKLGHFRMENYDFDGILVK